jgi:hypothetical protein
LLALFKYENVMVRTGYKFGSILTIAIACVLSFAPAQAASLKKSSESALQVDQRIISQVHKLTYKDLTSNLKLKSIPQKSPRLKLDVNLNPATYKLKPQSLVAEDQTNPLVRDNLLQTAATKIEEIVQASEVLQVTIDDTITYRYNINTTKSEARDAVPKLYAGPYSNIWTPATSAPPKKEIPEPSLILGLIAVSGLFMTQHQLRKRG